jgi:hypothetical protein
MPMLPRETYFTVSSLDAAYLITSMQYITETFVLLSDYPYHSVLGDQTMGTTSTNLTTHV